MRILHRGTMSVLPVRFVLDRTPSEYLPEYGDATRPVDLYTVTSICQPRTVFCTPASLLSLQHCDKPFFDTKQHGKRFRDSDTN